MVVVGNSCLGQMELIPIQSNPYVSPYSLRLVSQSFILRSVFFMDQEASVGAGYLARSPRDREIIDSIIAGAAVETLETCLQG